MAGQDDKFYQRELEKQQFAFEEADKDGRGFLTQAEVAVVLKTNGYGGTISDIKNLFKYMDKDGDRIVTKNEYLNALKKMPRLSTREWSIRRAFGRIDKDKSGFLSAEEIRAAAEKDEDARAALSEQSAEKLLQQLETTGGKVDCEAFLTLFGIEASATVYGQIFRHVDSNNDGTLSKAELEQMIETDQELSYNKEKLKGCLDALQTDADGKIDYNEFLQAWKSYNAKK